MISHWGSVHWGVGPILLRSLEVSKAWACMVKFSHRFDIWQASRQQRCRDTCQVSKRLGKSKHTSRSFEISHDLTRRRPPAYWVLMSGSGGTEWPWYQLLASLENAVEVGISGTFCCNHLKENIWICLKSYSLKSYSQVGNYLWLLGLYWIS